MGGNACLKKEIRLCSYKLQYSVLKNNAALWDLEVQENPVKEQPCPGPHWRYVCSNILSGW